MPNPNLQLLEFNPALRVEREFIERPGLVTRAVTKTLRSVVPVTPTDYVLFIDLSHWNGEIDFKALYAAGYRIVYLKATEGVTIVDSKFYENWNNALEAGFIVGVYHFFRSNLSGINQADFHKQHTFKLEEQTGGALLPNMCDVETADGATITTRRKHVLDFLVDMKQIRTPGCYSSHYLWKSLMGTVSWITQFHNWCASWTAAASPTLPPGWTRESTPFWQYGIAGKYSWCPVSVPGTSGQVDVNRSFLTMDQLYKLAGFAKVESWEWAVTRNLREALPGWDWPDPPVKT